VKIRVAKYKIWTLTFGLSLKGGEFMEDCIFCKIIKGEIPSNKIYEDDKVIAFHDINKEAPVHFLVIPKEHIESVNQINEKNSLIVSHIFLVINKLVSDIGIAKGGYRIVNNTGKDGGQSVKHIHFHVLGGRNLTWPPG
jgi:histidine triad (HIT) family protein